MDRPDGWGPSHQTGPRRRWIAKPPVLLAALGAGMLIASSIHFGLTNIAIALILVIVAVVVIDAILASHARPRAPRTPAIPAGADPLRAIRTLAARAGGGVWLGAGDDGEWRFARPERAVLLLGPPRSGKTSGVIIPAVLAHEGPAIVTSTKPDVARGTAQARARDGRVWLFDPTGARRTPAGVEQLRWSPVTSALTLGRRGSDSQSDDGQRRDRHNRSFALGQPGAGVAGAAVARRGRARQGDGDGH